MREAGGSGPLHSRIKQTLAAEIASGHWPPGGTLPGEPDLARRFGVSRMTVRQALGALADEGLLIRQRGRATRVAIEPIAQSLGRFYAFTPEMQRAGRAHHSRVLEVGLAAPGAAIRATLGLDAAEQVARITLLRFLGDEPLMIETASFPAGLLATIARPEAAQVALYDLLAEAGVAVSRATERIRPIALAAAQATLLAVAARTPAFHVQRTSYAGERAVEARESIVRGDRYQFVAELRRDQLDTTSGEVPGADPRAPGSVNPQEER